jgi:hypothetical protein
MSKFFLLTLSLLSSCVSFRDSISSRGLSLKAATDRVQCEELEWGKLQSFNESLFHIEFHGSPISVVIGYSSAEPDHVKNEASTVAREHRAEARPSVGFSVSF